LGQSFDVIEPVYTVIMSGREDFHGVRAGDNKRKAASDEATMGVAPKLPKTAAEKDKYVRLCLGWGVYVLIKMHFLCLHSATNALP
jgi:hypothetical protein